MPVRPTLEESNLHKTEGRRPNDRSGGKRELTQNSRAGKPKRCDLNCQSRADCSNNATPSRRPEAVGWAPPVGRPADYFLSGTLGQWLPAPCNGGPNKRAATLEPTKRQRGRPGPRAGMPILTKRYSQTSVGIAHKGGGPKTPMCEGEGTQGPWRRGATAGCRLSRQLLS